MNAVTDCEMDAFYGISVSKTAMEIGEQSVLDDMELVAEFFQECSKERSMSKFFGEISTPELFKLVVGLNVPSAQRYAAGRDLRSRLLSHFSSIVIERASEAMES